MAKKQENEKPKKTENLQVKPEVFRDFKPVENLLLKAIKNLQKNAKK